MSIKFDKLEILEQGEKLKEDLKALNWNLLGTQNSINFIVENAEFQGAFADSTKSYYSEVHGKAIDILITMVESLDKVEEKLHQNADIADSDDCARIETDYLLIEKRNEMQTVQDAYTVHKGAIQGEVSNVSDIVPLSMPAENFGDKAEDAKKELEKVAGKVYDFALTTLVNDVAGLMSSFTSLLTYMDSCQTPSGDFNYKAGDLEKQSFFTQLATNLQVAKDEQLNKPAADEEIASILKSLTPEEQKTFYRKMCETLGVPCTNEGFVEFSTAVGKDVFAVKGFWDRLCDTVAKNPKTDYTILRLINNKSNSEAFIAMIARSEPLSDLFLNAVIKTDQIKEGVSKFAKNGAVDFLLNLAVKTEAREVEGLRVIIKSDKFLNLGLKIADGDGTFMRHVKHLWKIGTLPKDFSKTSIILKHIESGAKWGKDIVKDFTKKTAFGAKWLPRFGKAAHVVGWAGMVVSTGINVVDNWEKTDGNVGRTITHTAIDAVCNVGPLEGMQAGMAVGSAVPLVGTVAGGIGGFIVGGAWQGVQWGVKKIGLGDIRNGLKDSLGDAAGDGLNWLGRGIKGTAETVGRGIKGTAETVGRGIKGTVETVGRGIKGTAETVGNGIKGTVETVGNGIKGTFETVGGFLFGR